jgi:hypothetical protein
MKLILGLFLFALCGIVQSAFGSSTLEHLRSENTYKKGKTPAICGKKSSSIPEDKAIEIAKERMLKERGEKGFRDFSDFIANKNSKSGAWIVIAYPESRVIDGHISVLMNKCGHVLRYKEGV